VYLFFDIPVYVCMDSDMCCSTSVHQYLFTVALKQNFLCQMCSCYSSHFSQCWLGTEKCYDGISCNESFPFCFVIYLSHSVLDACTSYAIVFFILAVCSLLLFVTRRVLDLNVMYAFHCNFTQEFWRLIY